MSSPRMMRLGTVLLLALSAQAPAQDPPLRFAAVVESPRAARMIEIAYLVLPATGQSQHPPLIALQGGPGIPGTGMAARFRADTALRRLRDVVLLDQRGVGASNRLSCDVAGPLPAVRDELFPPDFLSRCRDSLALRADLGAYDTQSSALDIEAVRTAIGAEVIDLYGISYGSRLAQEYVALFPKRVRRLVLDGVVPRQTRISVEAAALVDSAIERVIRDCTAAAECAVRHPQLRGEWRALRDSAGPARWRIAYALRGVLYTQPQEIPSLISEARRGDLRRVDSIYALRAAWVGNRTGTALHLGANCREDLAHVRPAEMELRSRGTLMRTLYYDQYASGCRIWNLSAPPAPVAVAPQPRLPTLLLSGEYDPVTPARYAELVSESSFPLSQHIVFARSGHAVPSACKSALVARFLDGGYPAHLDASCASAPGR